MAKSGEPETAIFIDGESLSASLWPLMQKFVHDCGQPKLTRVYGDFSNPSHAAWLAVCRENGLEPVLHMPVVAGKNGTDMLIAIAVMDLIHSDFGGTIVLVSNDRDFQPLARRIRMSGNKVHGLAIRAANACEISIFDKWGVLETAKPVKVQPMPEPVPEPAKLQVVKAVVLPEPEAALPQRTISSPTPKPAAAQTLPNPPKPIEVDKLATQKAKFTKLVRAKLAASPISLSALGMWVRQDHQDLRVLLGPGKLKKLVLADTRLKLIDNTVALSQ